MQFFNLKNYKKGWFIGNFEPTLVKTENFEIAIKKYKKSDKENAHYHKVADEYSIVINGKFKFNDKILMTDDIVLIKPNEKVDFECLEDGVNVVVKIPCAKNDKYLI